MKAPEDRIEAQDLALRRALDGLRAQVQGLLAYKEATARMRESVMKKCRVAR